MLKKALSVLTVCIILTHFAGFYVYYFFQLQVVRYEMREKLKLLPAHKLQLFTLPVEEFEKAKVGEHEIRVSGKMYDIAKTVANGNFIEVYCLHDEAEDNLVAFLNKITTLPLKDKNIPNAIFQFLSLNYLPVVHEFTFSGFPPSKSFTLYVELQTQFVKLSSSPPPKV